MSGIARRLGRSASNPSHGRVRPNIRLARISSRPELDDGAAPLPRSATTSTDTTTTAIASRVHSHLSSSLSSTSPSEDELKRHSGQTGSEAMEPFQPVQKERKKVDQDETGDDDHLEEEEEEEGEEQEEQEEQIEQEEQEERGSAVGLESDDDRRALSSPSVIQKRSVLPIPSKPLTQFGKSSKEQRVQPHHNEQPSHIRMAPTSRSSDSADRRLQSLDSDSFSTTRAHLVTKTLMSSSYSESFSPSLPPSRSYAKRIKKLNPESCTIADYIRNPGDGVPSSKALATKKAGTGATVSGSTSSKPMMTEKEDIVDPPSNEKLEDGEHGVEPPRSSSTALRLTIDDDGTVSLDPTSLTITATTRKFQEEDMERVEETDLRITSSSFSKRRAGRKWTSEETERFFKALHVYGTEFSLIETMFPGRTRRQIKAKYQREDRENHERVLECLRSRTPLDPEETEKILESIRKGRPKET